MTAIDEACRASLRRLEPYVDGELDAGHALEVEAHLARCAACRDRHDEARALRAALRRAGRTEVPDAVRARVIASVLAARTAPRPGLIGLRYAVPLAAAAGLAIAFGIARRPQPRLAETHPEPPVQSDMVLDALLEDLVTQHAQPLPPESTDLAELRRFEPYVGVPLEKPRFQPPQALFVGARVHVANNRRGAVLQYRMGNDRRVTMLVYNPYHVLPRSARMDRRLVRERPVFVGHVRGYAVAAAESKGVGYALASDLSDQESAELLVTSAP